MSRRMLLMALTAAAAAAGAPAEQWQQQIPLVERPEQAAMKLSSATAAIAMASSTARAAAPFNLAFTTATENSSILPLTYVPLPLGSISPGGWLRAELQTSANGLAGRQAEFYKYVRQSAWLGGSSEYSGLNEGFPYWFNGLVPMAYSLNDDRLKAQVHTAARYVLDHQQADGWLGPETGTGRTFWGRYPLCLGLIGLAEANSTWEKPVLDAMYKFNNLMYSMMQNNYQGYIYHQGDALGAGDFDWGRVRSQDMMITLMWLFDKHPRGSDNQRKLLSNIKALHDQGLNWENWYREDVYTFKDLNDLPQSITQNNYSFLHGVNVGQGLKAAAVVRRLTGDDSLIQTAANGVQWTFQYHGSPSGSVIADERLDGLAPYSGSELCTAVETMYSLSYLYQALGTNDYADRAELASFNALPVSMTGDWWAHQYMAQPNQPYSKNLSATPFYNTNSLGQIFGLEPNYPCCTVNHPQGLPKFASNSWVLSGNKGLLHALLSPSTVKTKLANGATVTVECATNYPFADTLTYTVTSSGPFDLYLRVPSWATGSTLSTSGSSSIASTVDSSSGLRYIQFLGASNGISFTHTLQAAVRTERRSNDTVAVYRGALLYALRIGSSVKSTPPKDYGTKQQLPSGYAPPQALDYTMTNTTAWNIAIDPATLQYDSPPASQSLSSPAFAEGAPPNTITAQGCQIEWPLHLGSTPGAPPVGSRRRCVGKPFQVTLVPYGSAKLHMSELPTVSLSGGGSGVASQRRSKRWHLFSRK